MADVIRTVGSGGDESTIGAALTWMKNGANYTMGTDDLGIIRIIDSAEYLITATLDFSSFTGTASATSHPVLEVDASNRHDGTYNTGKARIRNATGGVHCITIGQDYTHIKYCAIMQDSTGSSDECIRIASGASDVIIEKCVLYLDNSVASQDCIHASQYDAGPISVYDCVMRLGGSSSRSGIALQLFDNGLTNTQTWHIEHCTIDANGATGVASGAVVSWVENASSTGNLNVWNTIAFDHGGTDDYNEYFATTGGFFISAGQGNTSSDTSCQTVLGATNNQNSQDVSDSDVAATEILVTSLTADAENYMLVEGVNAANNALANAVDGGTRDSRIDTTTDIAGNARPTYASGNRDSGAFQLTSASVNTSIIVPTGPLR